MKNLILAGVAVLGLSMPAVAATTVKVDLKDDAITFSPESIPAGDVVFEVTNASVDEKHEMVVLKLDKPDTTIPVDPASDRIDEEAFTSMGEISKLTEGEAGTLTATLTPGSYMLLCNYKGHYRHGMHTVLTVK